MKRDSKYLQGVFVPRNKEKFIGTSAVYRSSLELKFFHFCDLNPNVLKWGSENIQIPYVNANDGKVHRYFVDNYVVIKEGNVIKKYLIEIKPSSQLEQPTASKGKHRKTLLYEQARYTQNQSKWKYAREFAARNGLEFKIITEKDLNPNR